MRDAHLMSDRADVAPEDVEVRLVIQMPGPRSNPITTTITIPGEDWATMSEQGREDYILREHRDFILREFEPDAEWEILTEHAITDPTEH